MDRRPWSLLFGVFTKQNPVTVTYAKDGLSPKLDIPSGNMQVTEAEADDIPVGDEDEDKKSSKVIVTGRDGKHDTSKSRLIVDDLRVRKFMCMISYTSITYREETDRFKIPQNINTEQQLITQIKNYTTNRNKQMGSFFYPADDILT